MTAETMSSSDVNRPIWRRARSTSERVRICSCSSCVMAARCFQRRTASATASARHSAAARATTALTVSRLAPRRAARELHARGRRGEIELQLLRVGQRDVDRRIAAGVDLVARQADDGERVAAERDTVAERQPGGAVGDHLVVAARDAASLDDLRRAARPRRLVADDVEPELAAAVLGLDRLVGDAARRRDAGDARDRFARVAGNARGLGERAARVGLDDPQIDGRRARDGQRIDDEPAIDADHRQTRRRAAGRGRRRSAGSGRGCGGCRDRRGSLAVSPRLTRARRPSLKPARPARDDLRPLGQAADDLEARILGAVPELHDALLQPRRPRPSTPCPARPS